MTRKEIVKAAFHAWARNLYQSTSLSDLSRELGVSKPALYRHFKNKQELWDAMYEYFFDNYTAFVKPAYDKAVTAQGLDCFLIIIRAIAEYYACNVDDFIFALIQVYANRKAGDMMQQVLKRGIDMQQLENAAHKGGVPCSAGPDAALGEGGQNLPDGEHLPLTQLVVAMLTFIIAHFHKRTNSFINTPSGEDIAEIVSFAEEILTKGIGFEREKVEALDYNALEERAARIEWPKEENSLLKAVGIVVGRVGPWDISMDMVAKQLGLSKSSLYSHFKNKQDMLEQFFVTELNKIVQVTYMAKQLSTDKEERLYLMIIGIANYLRSRKDILAGMDWLRTRDTHIKFPLQKQQEPAFEKGRFTGLFAEFTSPNIWRFKNETFPEGIFFLIINLLMRDSHKTGFDEATYSDRFRMLYKFITLGIESEWQ
jgi:AcrR family transcriptional regulator